MAVTLELGRPPVVRREASARRTRDPVFDNAKLLLVTAVVVGHAWAVLPRTALTQAAYDFLYLFHMPAFVIVTGYLSRSFGWSRRSLVRLVTTVAVPYVVFEGLLAAFRVWVGGEVLEDIWLDPHWAMWFLPALFVWRLVSPVLRALPAPLLVTVAGCLLGGLVTTEVLDAARILGFLPFFALGLLAAPHHVEMLRRPGIRLAAAGTLLTTAAAAPWFSPRISAEWFYWRSGYAELGVGVLEGAAGRLALLAVSTVLALAALSLMPRSARWFTPLGAASLVVYLCHGFVVKGLEYAGLGSAFEGRPVAGLLVTGALGVVLALLLAAPPVARRLNLLVTPIRLR